MIAKAKVISHGANAIRYSVDKDKAEIVKANLLPDDISPTAMWARMLALQKKFEDKLNRYHPLKRNMIRIEVSPTSEETQGWTMEEWQRLADDFIRAFDAVDLSAKSKRKSAKATNLKDSQYVVALHRDSKSGIMHLHIDANRIDIRGNVNDAHYIYERAMAAAAKVGQQRDWEIVKANLLPDDISPTAMWARMLALQKKFEDKLNRYHPLKRNMIRIEVSPTSEETQGWTMEEWQRLADDFIRAFDAVDLSAKSKRKSAKATNLKDSQYVVALHRDSKSGIMHLHIDANRIDIRGNVNDAHYIYERAMAAAAKVGQQRDWKDAQEVSRQNKEAIINDCLSVLAKMSYFDWGLYTKCLTQMGYDVKLQSDNKGQVRGYAIKRGNSIYKSSELGKGRCLMPSKIEGTWAKLHHQELEKPVSTPTKNTQQPKIMTVPKPMPTADDSPKIRHFDFYTDEFHHYPVDIPQNCLDIIDKNIALDADKVFAKIGDVQKTAILLFAEYIDAATTIAAQSGGGGGGATSGWGRDKDEDELSWAYRCAMMANRLCRPRKKQGYGR